ncbi:hypothetical protein [Methylobacterium dankookense]|uniref:Uncharacterized protein n=1 Tax=Methylobacterium dankookense TaxID=560405 RepID=A0A564G5U7_9HYPH|nr:hypothetical protein [Methylobacterium dankookense]GJD54204.1 hypothetical protein IFDJLNFL_0072 [Methylobacterium dankookense]VUF15404.1 hypothetical protein MTDSW087_05144 [Methylobacterium dankookense]
MPTADIVTPQDWDARVDRLSEKLPETLRRALDWLREPSRLWLRVGAAILFILGGIFSILPVLGLWMLPVGLALLAQDVPGLKVPLEKSARWIEATWARLKARWRS